MDNSFILSGTGIRLRHVEEKDLELLVKWRNDPENNKWFFNIRPLAMETQKQWLEKVSADNSRKFFIIEVLSENFRQVGTIGLYDIDYDHKCAEFGNFLIGEEKDRGKGYTKEAFRLLVDHAFFDLGLNKLYLYVFTHNHVARVFYWKNGFIKEGILRNAKFKNGRYMDVTIMGLLKYDYMEAKDRK